MAWQDSTADTVQTHPKGLLPNGNSYLPDAPPAIKHVKFNGRLLIVGACWLHSLVTTNDELDDGRVGVNAHTDSPACRCGCCGGARREPSYQDEKRTYSDVCHAPTNHACEWVALAQPHPNPFFTEIKSRVQGGHSPCPPCSKMQCHGGPNPRRKSRGQLITLMTSRLRTVAILLARHQYTYTPPPDSVDVHILHKGVSHWDKIPPALGPPPRIFAS